MSLVHLENVEIPLWPEQGVVVRTIREEAGARSYKVLQFMIKEFRQYNFMSSLSTFTHEKLKL